MPVLREVITRFRFETDEAGVRRFNGRVAVMKRGLRTLAAAAGITLGVAGAFAARRFGLAAEQAQFQLERLAGTDISRFTAIFNRVSTSLDRIRAGASQIIRPRQFDEAAANFVRVFGTGRREVQAFERIFAFAARQSALTGENVVQITKSLQDAIASGGFDALLDIPGFDQKALKLLQFQQSLVPEVPGDQPRIQARMQAILRIVEQSSAGQVRALKQVPEQLLSADRAANRMKETMENLGKVIADKLVPALNAIIKALDFITQKAGEAAKMAATAQGGALLSAGSTARFGGQGPLARLLAPAPAAEPTPGAVRAGGDTNINNTFNIRSTDPRSVAREVQRRQSDAMNEARASVPPVEER